MKILSIGNSFSDDAHRYISEIAKSNGENIKTVNLYIGGCSLELHDENIKEDKPAYGITYGGVPTGFGTSIKTALESDDWDVVTLQQASHFSFDYSTYQPFLKNLTEYVRKYAPGAKLYIHQTWSYRDGSENMFNLGFANHGEMFKRVKEAYFIAAQSANAPIIPGGEAMEMLACTNTEHHRDAIHASLGIGRYLLGLVWYETLTGKLAPRTDKITFDEPVSQTEIELAQKLAHKAVSMYREDKLTETVFEKQL